MTVKQIITPGPQCISPDASLMDAAAVMKKWDVGMLPVIKNDCLLGALSDRDIAVCAVAEGFDPNTTKVFQIMSGEIHYCFDYQQIEEVAETMEAGHIRRLMVLNRDRQLVGIVSLDDLTATMNKV